MCLFRILNSKRLKMADQQTIRLESQPSSVEIEVNPEILETAQERAILGLKRGGFGQQALEFSTPEPTEVQQAELAGREQGLLEQEAMMTKPSGFFSKIPEISPSTAGIIAGVAGGILSGVPYVAYEIGKDVINLFSKKEEKEEKKKDEKEEEKREERREKEVILIQPVVSPTITSVISPEIKTSSSASIRPYIRRKRRHQPKKK